MPPRPRPTVPRPRRALPAVVWLCVLLTLSAGDAVAQSPDRPNILWISAEDLSPRVRAVAIRYGYRPSSEAVATFTALPPR